MPTQKTYPIALAHGIARFDILRESLIEKQNPVSRFFNRIIASIAGKAVAPDKLHYFRGIRTHLENNGFAVRHTSVGFSKSLEARAAELKLQINGILAATGAKKVHIIAHSMGGLDSRYMIAKLEGMRDRVASLTTIGTPHHGTSFADHKLGKKGGDKIIDIVGKVVHLDATGFRDLTRDACRAFNESVRNAEAAAGGVFYQTYAAAEPREQVFVFLQPSWDIISEAEGDNDGLVSLTSQAWQAAVVGDDGATNTITQKRFPIPADHLNEVGWWDLNEARGSGPLHRIDSRDEYEDAIKQVYLDIAKDLAARFPV